jgi:hypothetical protein
MRYIVFGFCFLLGCQPSATNGVKRATTTTASSLFTDSAIYRAQCKEADSLPKLAVIPQVCTPRDQRVIVR